MSQQTLLSTDSPEDGRVKFNANCTELYNSILPMKYAAVIVVSAGSISSVTVLENTTGQTPEATYATGGGADYIGIGTAHTSANVLVSITSATQNVYGTASVGGSGNVSIYLRDLANGQVSTGTIHVVITLYA